MPKFESYSVFYKTKGIPDWHSFFNWYDTYEEAFIVYKNLKAKGKCTDIKIVKRTESFEDMEV